MIARGGLAWLCLLVGCGEAPPAAPTPARSLDAGRLAPDDGAAPPHDARRATAPDVEPDAAPDAQADPRDPLAALYARFEPLETIAGRGEIGERGLNNWRAEFEGGPAVEAELSRPHMAVADAAGRIYIADKDAHAVRRVDLDGTIHTVAGTNARGDGPDEGAATEVALNRPNGIFATPGGRVFVLDLGNAKVRVLDGDRLRTMFHDPRGMGTGRGLWITEGGARIFYGAGGELRVWTADDGARVLAAGFVSLGNLAMAPDGRLLVTDRGGHRVWWVDPRSGAKTPAAGNGRPRGGDDGGLAVEVALEEARAVAMAPGGGFLVGTHRGSQIWFIDGRGVAHMFLDGDRHGAHRGDGEPAATAGQKLSEIRGLSMTPGGDLLITEADVGYLRRLRARRPRP